VTIHTKQAAVSAMRYLQIITGSHPLPRFYSTELLSLVMNFNLFRIRPSATPLFDCPFFLCRERRIALDNRSIAHFSRHQLKRL
jgi:hypothetical protein